MIKIKVLELFGGISAPHKALINLGYNITTVDYVEFDEQTVEIRNAIYDTNFKAQSVVDYHYDGNEEVDLLIGGSPCQDFSVNGKGAGGDVDSGTRSSLMFEQLRIISEVMPKITIWENVQGVLSHKHIHNFNKYVEELKKLGYTSSYKVLNAEDFGIPQHRKRVYLVSVLNGEPFNFDKLEARNKKKIEEIIDFSLPYTHKYDRCFNKCKNYFALENNKGDFWTQYWRVYHKDSKSVGTVSTKPNYRIGINKEKNVFECRNLTPKEAIRLMGFSESDYKKISDFRHSKIFAVAGNSIVVDVLEVIFKELFKGKND